MFNLIALIKSIGYIGVWSTIFAETGILFGIFLPGDMLLFAVGVLAKQAGGDITSHFGLLYGGGARQYSGL